jgi:hypothetical protein
VLRFLAPKEAAMPEVKVRRTGIQMVELSSAIKDSLGDGYQVTQIGDNSLDVRKNFFIRAKVAMHSEPGGTVFDVRGAGTPIPLFIFTMMWINNQGIAKQVAAAIGSREEFRDNG